MTCCRLAEARVRADYAALGTLSAVARRHGVGPKAIAKRLGLPPGQRRASNPDPMRRAALLFSIGLTLDEAARMAGVDVAGLVAAIQARHARAIAAHAGR